MQNLQNGKLPPCPQVKTAIVACKLRAPKVIDGVAKLLTKSNLLALKHKDMPLKVVAFEKSLNEANQLVELLARTPGVSYDKLMDELYMLKIRGIAHLCGKGGSTIEEHTYESMNEIMEKFHQGVANISGIQQTPEKHIPEEAKATGAESLLSIQAVSNPVIIAAQAGFVKDAVVYEKGGTQQYYLIKSISDDGHFVQLVSREILSSSTVKETTTSLEQLLKNWLVETGKKELQFVISQAVLSDYAPTVCFQSLVDLTRAGLFYSMAEYANLARNSYTDKIELTENPKGAYALKSIDAEALCLVPQGPLNNIIASSSPLKNGLCTGHWIEVKGEKMQLYITKPSAPPANLVNNPENSDQADKKWVINPYYWVSSVND